MCDEKRQPDSGHLGDRAHAQPSQAAEKAPPNAHSQADGVLHRPLRPLGRVDSALLTCPLIPGLSFFHYRPPLSFRSNHSNKEDK